MARFSQVRNFKGHDRFFTARSYVTRVFENVGTAKRAVVEKKLKAVIERAVASNSMWKTTWEKMPLPKYIIYFFFN